MGDNSQAQRFPWGKPGTASQLQRRELVAVPGLRRAHRSAFSRESRVCLRALGVAAEDAKEVGDLAEVVEGVDGDGGIGASQEVQIEEVLPGLAAQRAGFDLHQVEIAKGEGAEGAEEGAGDIAGAEYQRCFPLRV